MPEVLAMTETIDDGSSDYGDFTLDEQEIIDELSARIPAAEQQVTREPLAVPDIEDYEESKSLQLPKNLDREFWVPPQEGRQRSASPAVAAQDRILGNKKRIRDVGAATVDSATAKRAEQGSHGDERQESVPIKLAPETSNLDTRSPIERFRTKPKKALSVTDLVSPAWCELQYSYTLSKHGKKPATAAMRQGSNLHKIREEEIHITVSVETTTKEDRWGLRIWNIIQGLRTLRETGTTRELEVWGIVDGEIVNGVIDELSYECPVPDLAEATATGQQQHADEQMRTQVEKSASQASITDYLFSEANGASGKTFGQLGTKLEAALSTPPPPSDEHEGRDVEKENIASARKTHRKEIYLTEIKTRRVKSLPTPMTFGPTAMQLQLYHWMLESLTRGQVPLQKLLERYELHANRPLSDTFIAQVGGLNDHLWDTLTWQQPPLSPPHTATLDNNVPTPTPPNNQTSLDLLLNHNSLSSLWDLMIQHLQRTFLPNPHPPSPSTSLLSPLLTALYLHPQSQAKLGTKTLLYSAPQLAEYVRDGMAWWKGRREARGVRGGADEVSLKCGRCEFKGECEWFAGLGREKEKEKEKGG